VSRHFESSPTRCSRSKRLLFVTELRVRIDYSPPSILLISLVNLVIALCRRLVRGLSETKSFLMSVAAVRAQHFHHCETPDANSRGARTQSVMNKFLAMR